MNGYKEHIKGTFKNVIESPEYNEDQIRKYFSESYVQHVDGKVLDFKQFLEHNKALKSSVTSLSVHFITLVQEDQIVFTRHTVNSVTKSGGKGETMVIAEFHIMDGKINYCNELTYQISGDEQDRDLASRH